MILAFSFTACVPDDDTTGTTTYTVTFNSNGGSAVASITGLTSGSKINAPTAPTKADHNFDAWYKDNGTFANEWNFDTDTVTANITLYANWNEHDKYSVHFNSNGGSEVASKTGVTTGSTITAPTAPTRSGYDFEGWFKDNGTFAQPWDFESDTVTETITLYAKWLFVYTPGLEFQLITDGDNANTYRVRRGSVYSGEVVIPATYNGLLVTEIGSSSDSYSNGAFYNTAITSVTIPSSVTTIGNSAFYQCSNLASVTIPSSVTSIPYSAFYGCSSLVSINVDSANLDYSSADGVLFNKTKTTLVTYPPGKTETSYVIPSSVTSFGEYAFQGCTSLASVTIPSSVTSIGENAFFWCTSLTSVTIPSSVTSIGDSAFMSCSSLASITIPSGVTSIGNGAFAGCSSLASVTIPNSVTSIGIAAFSGCSNLASVTIPSSVTSISSYAFSNCTSLASVTFEGTITEANLNSSAFGSTGNLRAAYLTGGIGTYTTPDTAQGFNSTNWAKVD